MNNKNQVWQRSLIRVVVSFGARIENISWSLELGIVELFVLLRKPNSQKIQSQLISFLKWRIDELELQKETDMAWI